MIELTMTRMERVEAILATAKSEWAIKYWSNTLEYLKRQLKNHGGQL